MFEEIIKFDMKKVEEQHLDIDKINAYLDEIHLSAPDITKKENGHYVGITTSTELAHFGNAIWALQCSQWFRDIVVKWELWENDELEEDLIETTERIEEREGFKLYDKKEHSACV